MQGRQARMLRKTMQTAPKSLVSGLKERRCDVEGCARVQRLRRCERTDYVAATFRSAPLMSESHGDDGKNVHCNGERKPRPPEGGRYKGEAITSGFAAMCGLPESLPSARHSDRDPRSTRQYRGQLETRRNREEKSR